MENRIVVTRRPARDAGGDGTRTTSGGVAARPARGESTRGRARRGRPRPGRPTSGRPIPLEAWLAWVRADPLLEPVRLAANEPDELRDAHPVRLTDGSTIQWLYWTDGEIWAEDPEPATLSVMLRAATAFGARVTSAEGSLPGPRRDEATEAAHAAAERTRRRCDAVLVIGTIVCVASASALWLMQA